MKKTLFTLFTAISFALLYCPACCGRGRTGQGCRIRQSVPVAAVRYRFSKSQHQTGRYSAFIGHRRFAFARLNAVRSVAGFSWF